MLVTGSHPALCRNPFSEGWTNDQDTENSGIVMNWTEMLARFLYPLRATLSTGRIRNQAIAVAQGGAASAPKGTDGIPHERSGFRRECRAELRERD